MKLTFVENHSENRTKPVHHRISVEMIWLLLLFIASISVRIIQPARIRIYSESFEESLTPPTLRPHILVSSYDFVAGRQVKRLKPENPDYILKANESAIYNSDSSDEIRPSPLALRLFLPHPFGTDTSGRDLLIRCVAAFGVYLIPALVTTIFSVGLGVWLGVASATIGRSDRLVALIALKIINFVSSALLNVLEVIPKYVAILLLIAAWPNSNLTWIAATLGILNSSKLGKILRDRIKSLYKEEFTEASLALGISQKRLIFTHILGCYALPSILTQALRQISELILVEVTLAYLGAISDWSYGVTISEPTPSWGNILMIGRDHLIDGWWLTFFPLIIIATTLSSIQMISYKLCRSVE